jgi:hypothetical protein
MIQSAIGTQLQESNIVSDRVRITWAQLHQKVWARPMTTWRRSSASPVVVSQKFASAFDCPGTTAGLLGKASESCAADPRWPRCDLFLARLPVPQPGGFGT